MEETQKSFVAFIDILGFKKMVDEYYDGSNKTILTILKDALNKAKQHIKDSDLDLGITSVEPSYKQFSDSISLSVPLTRDDLFLPQLMAFILLIGSYQKILMENKIFCRGGIAFEDHYEDDDFIFSKSLIKAYNNEIEIAIYPRIVIDNELIKKIKSELKGSEPEIIKTLGFSIFNDRLEALIIEDWEGVYFVNPFDYFFHLKMFRDYRNLPEDLKEAKRQYIERHNNSYRNILQIVVINIEKYKDDYAILKKYLWLREFLIWHNEPTKSRIVFERMK